MTSFQLKILACVFMLIDHVALYLPGMPVWMHWIGRLAFPIFLFLIGWSCIYTSNRRRFLMRLYIASVIMSIIQFLSYVLLDVLPYTFGAIPIDANIFRTLFHTCLIICLLSASDARKRLSHMALYVLIQVILAAALPFVGRMLESLDEPLGRYGIPYMIQAVSGTIIGMDGGLYFIIVGVSLWAVRNNRVRLSLVFGSLVLIYIVLMATPILSILMAKITLAFPDDDGTVFMTTNFVMNTLGFNPVILGRSAITVNYQWMMIFSLPFMLLYNHRRGPNVKWFFYIFYPAHIIVLFLTGIALNNYMLF